MIPRLPVTVATLSSQLQHSNVTDCASGYTWTLSCGATIKQHAAYWPACYENDNCDYGV